MRILECFHIPFPPFAQGLNTGNSLHFSCMKFLQNFGKVFDPATKLSFVSRAGEKRIHGASQDFEQYLRKVYRSCKESNITCSVHLVDILLSANASKNIWQGFRSRHQTIVCVQGGNRTLHVQYTLSIFYFRLTPQKISGKVFDPATKLSFVSRAGIEHYMFSTPCRYFTFG